ncbi:MAG TPA: hypothetical protein PLC42_07310 [Parachlamydiaceae bacterium]|nr:hypothetical protein [Parachlamydiaceae bacterium]
MVAAKQVTEVFITKVPPSKHAQYKEWASKIQYLEAKFPGYLGTYLQAPDSNTPNDFVTILHFDTEDNLNCWLNSKERQEIVKASKNFVDHYEGHRLESTFPGWFPSCSPIKKTKLTILKENMFVLLVLFPIVMLELKFLNPYLKNLTLSVSTFIGNALSVALITWPTMPICLYFMRWWLSPEISKKENILGFCIVFSIYALEILFFYSMPLFVR